MAPPRTYNVFPLNLNSCIPYIVHVYKMTATEQLQARRASAVVRYDSAGEIVSVFQTHHHGALDAVVQDSCLEMYTRASQSQVRKRSHSKPSIRRSRIELSVALSEPSSAKPSAKHDGGTLGTASATLQLISASA